MIYGRAVSVFDMRIFFSDLWNLKPRILCCIIHTTGILMSFILSMNFCISGYCIFFFK